MEIVVKTLVCVRCKIEKPETEFNKEKRAKSGKRSDCRLCSREYQKQFHKTEKWKEYLKKNSDKNKEYNRKFREENREYVRVRQQEYRKRTPEKIAEYLKRASEQRKLNAPNVCTIYLLENKVNGKVYIGQTWQTIKDRFSNGYGYVGCHYLNNAIKKYSKENFQYIVLKECETQLDADTSEAFFISEFDSTNKHNGYNIKYGGSVGKHSEETKIKMRIAHKGRRPSALCLENSAKARRGTKASDETRKKQSIAKLGKPSPHKGKKMTEEQKKKFIGINLGKRHSEESKRNMSLSQMGRVVSPETRAKISKSNMGKKISEEHRLNLVISHLGHKQSAETINKRSLALKGRIVSKETREKISKWNKGKIRTLELRKRISESLKGNTNKRNYELNRKLN